MLVMAEMEKVMAKIREAKANHAKKLEVSIADCHGSMMMNGDECMMMCGCGAAWNDDGIERDL